MISFANRILSTALHDSNCVFIGLSFTDVNLVRWLGMGAVEREMDLKSEASIDSRSSVPGFRSHRQPHFWIKTENADPSGLISRLLDMRGVNTITIDSWQFTAIQQRDGTMLSARLNANSAKTRQEAGLFFVAGCRVFVAAFTEGAALSFCGGAATSSTSNLAAYVAVAQSGLITVTALLPDRALGSTVMLTVYLVLFISSFALA
jgi:hypothetical protein